MEFIYKIDETAEFENILEKLTLACPLNPDEKIEVNNFEKGVGISANRQGWLTLAKICVEMAYCSQHDPGYHIHRTKNFEQSSDLSQDAISLFVK